MLACMNEVTQLIDNYRVNLDGGDVIPDRPYEEVEELLKESLPKEGTSIPSVMDQIRRDYIPNCSKVGHPNFLAWMNNSSCDAGLLGEMINVGLAQVPFTFKGGKSATVIEHLVTEWFCQIFNYPENSSGSMVSGGTVANLTALTVAREKYTDGAMERGLQNRKKILRIYTSEQVHVSIERAVGILGIGMDHLVKVPCDEYHRMDVEALEAAIKKDRDRGYMGFCVVAQGGSATVGAVDSIEAIADICQRYDLWLHVDAAYGGGAILTDYGKKVFKGIERADSITTDPHKWFYMPVEAGLILFRDKCRLTNTFLKSSCSSYRGEMDSVNRMNNGIQIAQTSKSFKVWFALKVYGLDLIKRCIEKDIELARFGTKLFLETGRWDIVNAVDLSILCVRYKSEIKNNLDYDKLHMTILDEYEKSGEGLLTQASVDGAVSIRICFANHRTTKDDVMELVKKLDDIAKIEEMKLRN